MKKDPSPPEHNRATLDELSKLVLQFRDDRDWKQFHNPKDMALSLALEAAELMELMQWHNGQELDEHLRAKPPASAKN